MRRRAGGGRRGQEMRRAEGCEGWDLWAQKEGMWKHVYARGVSLRRRNGKQAHGFSHSVPIGSVKM